MYLDEYPSAPVVLESLATLKYQLEALLKIFKKISFSFV